MGNASGKGKTKEGGEYVQDLEEGAETISQDPSKKKRTGNFLKTCFWTRINFSEEF